MNQADRANTNYPWVHKKPTVLNFFVYHDFDSTTTHEGSPLSVAHLIGRTKAYPQWQLSGRELIFWIWDKTKVSCLSIQPGAQGAERMESRVEKARNFSVKGSSKETETK